MLYFFIFYLGAIVGSFTYVCVLRLPKNEDFIFKKSYCESCNKPIKWFENMPLVSYIFLKGKASCCQNKISSAYFITEFFIGLIFLINSFLFDNFQASLLNFLIVVLIIIILIDYNEKIIFDVFSFILIFLGLAVNYFAPNLNPFSITIINSIVSILVSSTLFFLLQYLYKKIKKIDGLGTGDIILIAGLTAWTGFLFFLYLLILSSITGIIYYLLFNKEKALDFEIPYGSSLGVSFILLIYTNNLLIFN